MMTGGERERYARQIVFPPLGEQGQERLLASRVAIAGCGALGSFQAGALARAGTGYLRVIDRDYVEVSNLQRQWLFEESDAAEGLPKAVAGARAIGRINSGVRVQPEVADITPASIDDLLEGVDIVLDATDNFETRYLVNDWCVNRGIPWVYGAAVGSYGLTMPVLPGRTCCLTCLYPEPPAGAQPTCETAGVLNPITALVAALQVAAAMRILAGGEPAHKLTTLDVWSGEIRQLALPAADPSCPTCGLRSFPHLNGQRRAPVSLCGRNAVQIHDFSRPIDLEELASRLRPIAPVKRNEFALRFFPAPFEITVFPDGRAIIKGTQDTGLARSLYARYIGS
jgi:adenylyltransferase/sulfurtransferase